jgi:NADPH-dependent 2,4-dienoyl-CoA reductase/sulfur reductase-like enzyme
LSHILIIGGSDAGISAVLRAKELDLSVDVTVVVADAFPNYRGNWWIIGGFGSLLVGALLLVM